LKAFAFLKQSSQNNPYPVFAGGFALVCLLASIVGLFTSNSSREIITAVKNDSVLANVDSAPEPQSPMDLLQISTWHLFGESEANAPANLSDTPPETQLQLKLLGVFNLSNNPAATHAIIEADDQVQKTYRVNETLPGGAVLEAVENNKAILLVDNQRESLSLQKFNSESQPAVEDPSLSAQ
jgi:general secretion pathway protein C